MIVYGREAVQDAPARGGMILFVTVPLAGMLSALFFVVVSGMLYRRFR